MMRKIDKNCDLSSKYKAWEEDMEDNNKPHPKYSSSNGKYYWDIKMQLHRCQRGLCAYTEKELCDEEFFSEECWEEGSYKNRPEQAGKFGDLEHFDENLKTKKGDEINRKDWLWRNFFVVDSDVNNWKGTQEVDDILKPDREGYDPFSLLDYVVETHEFIPKRGLEEEIEERVRKMILVLGINTVRNNRRKYLRKLFRLYRLGALDDFLPPNEYPTAYEFCKQQIERQEKDITDQDLTF
ncbi:MAG: hypothetical protein AAF847_03815 [Bacteroidota bacterium]